MALSIKDIHVSSLSIPWRTSGASPFPWTGKLEHSGPRENNANIILASKIFSWVNLQHTPERPTPVAPCSSAWPGTQTWQSPLLQRALGKDETEKVNTFKENKLVDHYRLTYLHYFWRHRMEIYSQAIIFVYRIIALVNPTLIKLWCLWSVSSFQKWTGDNFSPFWYYRIK